MKKEKGITLIALVITIIVILILAGVTIATLTGDNGLLQKAQTASEKNSEATALEKIQVEVAGSYGLDGKIDINLLNKNLKNIDGLTYKEKIINTDVNSDEYNAIQTLPDKVKLNGYSYKIKDNGEVSGKNPLEVGAEDIVESPKKYYGKYVTNYNSLSDAGINANEGQKWQIFLADDTNIYLIASNQIHKNYAPLNYNKNGDYCMYFTDILSLYNTSTTGNPSVATLLGKLSKQNEYHEWLNTPTNLKNKDNQKAVLSMLDTDKWNEYMDGTTKKGYKNAKYASYVIGSPTVEMFCKSYNETHDVIKIKSYAKENSEYYSTGYKIQKGTETVTTWIKKLNDENLDVDNMYFKCNYWLSSPSADAETAVINVGESGDINDYGYFNNSYCFRPLVCLKSDVSLIEKTIGNTITYELD